MRTRTLIALAALLAITGTAQAQLLTVPQRGVADLWVKNLKIELAQDWEWVETYEDRVFFATRLDARRNGDVVKMWTRVEYKDPQGPAVSPHRSAVSWDDWDCKTKRRGTAVMIMYRYNNLEDNDPLKATNPIKAWVNVQPDTIGTALLEFACAIQPTQELTKPEVPTQLPAKKP